MTVWFYGLSAVATERARKALGVRVFPSIVQSDYDTYDVLLNDAAILKTRFSVITIDLGGRLVSIAADEFNEIIIK